MKVKCKECGREYTLKDDENPKDYTCECGGDLRSAPIIGMVKSNLIFIYSVLYGLMWFRDYPEPIKLLFEILFLALPIFFIISIIYRKNGLPHLELIEGTFITSIGVLILIMPPKGWSYGISAILLIVGLGVISEAFETILGHRRSCHT